MIKKVLFALCTILMIACALFYLFYNHYLDATALARPFNALGFQPALDERYDFPEELDVGYDSQAGIYFAQNELLIQFYENVTNVEKKEVAGMMDAEYAGETEEGYVRMLIPAALSLTELQRLCENMPLKSVCVEAAYVDKGI